jgi:hypothetical protein
MVETYLARIISQSVKADGSLDRDRLCHALEVAPHDPITIVVEAVLEIRTLIETQKKDFKAIEGSHATALTAVFKENCTQLSALLSKHMEEIENAKDQLGIMKEDLSVARAEVLAQQTAGNDALTKNSAELVTLARETRDLTAKHKGGQRTLLFTLCAFFLGLGLALIFCLLLLKHRI